MPEVAVREPRLTRTKSVATRTTEQTVKTLRAYGRFGFISSKLWPLKKTCTFLFILLGSPKNSKRQ